jgi:hypothetical protein
MCAEGATQRGSYGLCRRGREPGWPQHVQYALFQNVRRRLLAAESRTLLTERQDVLEWAARCRRRHLFADRCDADSDEDLRPGVSLC